MKSVNLQDVIALVGLVLPVSTALFTAIFWLVNYANQRYGVRRDIGHIKNSIKQLSDNANYIAKDVDRRFDDIERYFIEIKANYNNKK